MEKSLSAAGVFGCNQVVTYLLGMHDTVRLYHWQTRSHARHVATCQLLAELLPLVDKLVESYIGRYERPSFKSGRMSLDVPELTDSEADKKLQAYGFWLKQDFPKYVKPHDTDLLNIRDEILGVIHQTLYRFTLY
jgi:hypothetical protein